MNDISHLVLSGGAMRGFIYIGVLRYLYVENMYKSIKNVAGTSIGSIFALAFALKIPIEYLEEKYKGIANDKDKMFIDKSKILNLISCNGIIDSFIYIECLKDYIKEKYEVEDLSFIELSKKTGINLYVSCTSVNDNINKIFSIEETPNVSIFKAVSASISIPFIFKPVKIDNEFFIDGGLTNNFPINIFNKIPKENILGVAIRITESYTLTKIEKNGKLSFFDFFNQLFNIINVTVSKSTTDSKIDETNNNIIIIRESHIDNWIKLNITKEGIYFSMNGDDIDRLIIQGYTIIYNHFKNKINKIEDLEQL